MEYYICYTNSLCLLQVYIDLHRILWNVTEWKTTDFLMHHGWDHSQKRTGVSRLADFWTLSSCYRLLRSANSTSWCAPEMVFHERDCNVDLLMRYSQDLPKRTIATLIDALQLWSPTNRIGCWLPSALWLDCDINIWTLRRCGLPRK